MISRLQDKHMTIKIGEQKKHVVTVMTITVAETANRQTAETANCQTATGFWLDSPPTLVATEPAANRSNMGIVIVASVERCIVLLGTPPFCRIEAPVII